MNFDLCGRYYCCYIDLKCCGCCYLYAEARMVERERGPKNVPLNSRPLNDVEREIVLADIAYLKQKEIESGDWDKWQMDQKVNNAEPFLGLIVEIRIDGVLVNPINRYMSHEMFYAAVGNRYITPEIFRASVGYDPVRDDLIRCNCPVAGSLGHESCGWCASCNQPAFSCGHIIQRNPL